MMHRSATRIYRATKDLSRSQEMEYWRQKAAQLLPGHTEPARRSSTVKKRRKAMES